VTGDWIGLKIENEFNSLFHKHQEITVFLFKVMPFFAAATQKVMKPAIQLPSVIFLL